MLRKANSPVEGTIKLMFSVIALSIIAVAMCILVITYYREREDLVRQLRDIDYSLSEMRASLNKLEHINNKMLAIENKVQTSIDRTSSVKTYVENDVAMHLTNIKTGQETYSKHLYAKINKLYDVIDIINKEDTKRHQDTIKSIDKSIVDSECRVGIKLNTINERLDTIGGCVVAFIEEKKKRCEAKNSSKTSKTKDTTKSNKQGNDKLKTAE